MKKIILLFILFSAFISLQAQKVYTIGVAGKIIETISPDASASYIFNIHPAFVGKKFDIYSGAGVHQNPNFNLIKTNIPKNNAGGYTVTIDAMHKLKECIDSCLFTVTDTFSVKLDNKVIGNFVLTPLDFPKPEAAPGKNGSGNITSYQSGSIINDALFIASNLADGGDKDKVNAILLKQYKIKEAADKNANKFLAAVIDDKILNGTQGGVGLKGIANSIGGLDVTNIADGFAKFIVKRAKEELSIAFFQKFKDELETYKDLKTVFPKTHALLVVIDQEIYTYSNYINNLREAFRADIKVLDENLPGIIENNKPFFNLDKNYIYKVSLLSGCYLSRSLKNDLHPADILQGFPLNYFDGSPTADKTKIDLLKGSIQTLQLFSESLKESDTSKRRYWVDAGKLRELVDNEVALKIYLGLVIEVAKLRYNNIPYSTSANLYKLLNDQTLVNNFSIQYTQYKQFITSIGSKADQLNKMIKDFDDTTSDSLKVEKYAKYFGTTVELIQSATEVSNLPAIADITEMNSLKQDSKPYFDVAYQVTDLVSAINRKRYPEAVNNLVLIYNSVYVRPAVAQIKNDPKELTKKEKIAIANDVIAAAKTDGTQDIGSIVNRDANIAATIENNDPTLKGANHVVAAMAKYGAFMANVIDAKNSDEVAAAIESVALPVGSASIKRKTSFNVSLNAYCGLFTGSEIIKGVDANKPFKFNSYGITAPIGISISRGNSLFFIIPTGKIAFSSSVFISLVDIGAITAYRFEDSTAEQVPTIKLRDIFSPGLFLSTGIPKTPISVNLGAQTGPNLRKVNSTANDYSNSTYIRYSVSICVDIPLLNLYTRSKL